MLCVGVVFFHCVVLTVCLLNAKGRNSVLSIHHPFCFSGLLGSFSKLCREHAVTQRLWLLIFMSEALRKLDARFHAFVNGVATSQGLRTQQFFATFMARYRCLSSLVGDLLIPIGTIMPSTTYGRVLVDIVHSSRQQGSFCVRCVYVCECGCTIEHMRLLRFIQNTIEMLYSPSAKRLNLMFCLWLDQNNIILYFLGMSQ